MEKMEDDDVIFFFCATLLVCAVDVLSNEKVKKIKKSKNLDERWASWVGYKRSLC